MPTNVRRSGRANRLSLMGVMSSISLNLDNQALAQDYERISAERQFKSGQVLIAALAIASEERVLDVGSGTGLLADYVADLVGPTGSVVGIDPLPPRIEIATRKTRSNLSFRVGNAYDLSEFPADSFDVAYLSAVLHWLPEKLGPLRQIFRVLRSGGRLGISTGSKSGSSRLHEIKAQILSREPYCRHPESLDGRAYWVSADELKELLVKSGFEIKKIEERTTEQEFPNAEAAIRFSEASSFGNFLGHLPEPLRNQAREEIKRELERLMPEGTRRKRLRILAVATKP